MGLILGMDPMTMLKATGKAAKPFANGTAYDHIKYYSGTREVNRYRAVTTVKNVLEVFSFLHVLQLVWEEKLKTRNFNYSHSGSNDDMQMPWKAYLSRKSPMRKSTS